MRLCQGCRQLSLSLTFKPILAFRGPPNSDIVDKGFHDAKKVAKHWSSGFLADDVGVRKNTLFYPFAFLEAEVSVIDA